MMVFCWTPVILDRAGTLSRIKHYTISFVWSLFFVTLENHTKSFNVSLVWEKNVALSIATGALDKADTFSLSQILHFFFCITFVVCNIQNAYSMRYSSCAGSFFMQTWKNIVLIIIANESCNVNMVV
jgi:hypothetical protein